MDGPGGLKAMRTTFSTAMFLLLFSGAARAAAPAQVPAAGDAPSAKPEVQIAAHLRVLLDASAGRGASLELLPLRRSRRIATFCAAMALEHVLKPSEPLGRLLAASARRSDDAYSPRNTRRSCNAAARSQGAV